MRVKATVTEVHKTYAVVESERLSACEGCHKSAEGCSVCSLMGGNRTLSTRAGNAVGAKVGDVVEVETETATVMRYAALVFLLPLVCMLLAYGIAMACKASQTVAYIAAGAAFCLTFVGIGVYSRCRLTQKQDVQIVRILEKEK